MDCKNLVVTRKQRLIFLTGLIFFIGSTQGLTMGDEEDPKQTLQSQPIISTIQRDTPENLNKRGLQHLQVTPLTRENIEQARQCFSDALMQGDISAHYYLGNTWVDHAPSKKLGFELLIYAHKNGYQPATRKLVAYCCDNSATTFTFNFFMACIQRDTVGDPKAPRGTISKKNIDTQAQMDTPEDLNKIGLQHLHTIPFTWNNFKEACQNFTLAIMQGSLAACCNLGSAWLEHYPPQNLSDEKNLGYKLLLNSHAKGYLPATLELGNYFYNKGVKNMAFKYYKHAADEGTTRAQFLTARLLEMGDGVEENRPEAFTYYVRAASGEDIEIQKKLTPLFTNLPYNLVCFHRNVNEITAEIKEGIAHIFFKGKGVKKDLVLANFWILSAMQTEGKRTTAEYRDQKEALCILIKSKKMTTKTIDCYEKHFALDEAVYKDVGDFLNKKRKCFEELQKYHESITSDLIQNFFGY